MKIKIKSASEIVRTLASEGYRLDGDGHFRVPRMETGASFNPAMFELCGRVLDACPDAWLSNRVLTEVPGRIWAWLPDWYEEVVEEPVKGDYVIGFDDPDEQTFPATGTLVDREGSVYPFHVAIDLGAGGIERFDHVVPFDPKLAGKSVEELFAYGKENGYIKEGS